MNLFLKLIIILFFSISINSGSFAFDLKKLQQKLEKNLKQIQKPKSSSGSTSNPLGGLLKNLNKKGLGTGVAGTAAVAGSSSSSAKSTQSNGNSNAKRVCDPSSVYGKLIKNLPGANIANLEKDFGKSSKEIKSLLEKNPPRSNDQIVSSLETFSGAFETKEIELLFNKFLLGKDLDSLSQIREIAGIKAGFSKDKKQIKADANFAYGVIHYIYSSLGSNKNLGIQYIKNAAGSSDNIGALVVYGAWQFYGINVGQNIENGNKMAMDGYNRAFDKNLKVETAGKFKGMKKFTYGEKIFFAIASDNRNPYKQQYQNQLAEAAQMEQQVKADLAKDGQYRKSGWWPSLIAQQNRQHELLSLLGENLGIAKELSDLKGKYLVLKSKVSSDNKLLERMVIINQEMNERVQKALKEKDAVDQKGKENIANLQYDNDIMIMQNDRIGVGMTLLGPAGAGGFGEMAEMFKIVGLYERVACKIYSGVKSYAKRTNVQLKKPPTNPKAKFTRKFGRQS